MLKFLLNTCNYLEDCIMSNNKTIKEFPQIDIIVQLSHSDTIKRIFTFIKKPSQKLRRFQISHYSYYSLMIFTMVSELLILTK
jgi:hypothetical protein